ncbi:MAG: LCP family protein [Patescibacteria group bacterium]|mgnify:CR=1 FL=1
MHFKKRRIGQRQSYRIQPNSNILTALGLLLVIFFVVYGISRLFANFSISGLFNVFSTVIGKELQTDEYGNTNILLLGAGGEGHIGENLTDTIILASIDTKSSGVTLLSIPRDLYVTPSSLGGIRINKVYDVAKKKFDSKAGLEILREEISEISGLQVQYYAKVDFTAFETVVDSLGGVDIVVDKTINDPLYPKGETYDYERFYLPAGLRHLDGKTALKYVRSRQSSSDFDRSYRQQKLLVALREKISDRGLATDTGFLKKMFRAVQDHVETNMDLRELMSLASLGKDVTENNMLSISLHDDWNRRGGFLYSPVRELYGGAYVLLPAGDVFTHIQNFIKLGAYHREQLENPMPLQILNGTKSAGMAGGTKMILQRFGFQVDRFGNGAAQDVQTTKLYYKNKEQPPEVLDLLQGIIGGEKSADVPQEYLTEPYLSDAEVVIVLGQDFVTKYNELDITRGIVQMTPATPESTEE